MWEVMSVKNKKENREVRIRLAKLSILKSDKYRECQF